MNDTALNAATLPPLPKPAYKDRRGWLIAFGIVEILIACFFLLAALMSCLMVLAIPNMAKQTATPAPPSWLFLFVAFFYGILGAIFAAAGIGSIQAKNWARILMIALSSLWLAFGVLGTLGFAVMLPTMLHQQEAILSQNPAVQQGQLPPNFMGVVMAISLAFQVLFMVVLPLVFLIFYTRKSVKATCEKLWAPLSPAPAAPFAPPPTAVPAAGAIAGPPLPATRSKSPPIPVLVAMIWFAIMAMSALGTALALPITILFGVRMQGMEARLVLLVFAVVYAFCAWSFYKLRIAGWWTAVAFSGFYMVSGLVTVTKMKADSFSGLYDEVYRKMGIDPQQTQVFMPDPHLMAFFQWFGWFIAVAFFILVLYTKRYFRS